MNDRVESAKWALAWVRQNAKILLAGLNVVILLFLLYLVVSQMIFERGTGKLLRDASAVAAREKQSTAAKPPADSGARREAPSRGQRSGKRGWLGNRVPDRAGNVTTGTTASAAVASSATAEAQPSSTTLVTTGALATAPPITTGPAVTSDTATTSPAVASAAQLSSAGRPTTFAMALAERMARLGARVQSIGRRVGFDPGGPPGDGSQPSTSTSKAKAASPAKPKTPPPSPEEAKRKELLTKLQQRALFGGQKPVAQQPQLEAVLGDSVLISGQWLKLGEKFGDKKLVEFAADRAVLEDDAGQRQEVTFPGEAGGGPGRPSGPGRPGGPQTADSKTPPGAPGGPSSPKMTFGSDGMPTGDMRKLIIQRLTGPGGRFEGMSSEDLERRFQDMRGQRGDRGEGDRGRRKND